MSRKKKQPEPEKPSRFLGVRRVQTHAMEPTRAVCFWKRPFLLLRIQKHGETSIAEWSSVYATCGQIGIFSTEKEACAQGEKFSASPLAEGDWYEVLDLRGIGPAEVPLTTD